MCVSSRPVKGGYECEWMPSQMIHLTCLPRILKRFSLTVFSSKSLFLVLGETFFIHWFTDPPTVNVQNVKYKKKIGCQQFYDFSSLNTDLRFARPKICAWEAQNEGLMKIMSKRSTVHFAFCNN